MEISRSFLIGKLPIERIINSQTEHSPSCSELHVDRIVLHEPANRECSIQLPPILHVADHAHLLVEMAQRLLSGPLCCLVRNEGLKAGRAKNACRNAVGEERLIDRPNLLLQGEFEGLLLRITVPQRTHLIWRRKGDGLRRRVVSAV